LRPKTSPKPSKAKTPADVNDVSMLDDATLNENGLISPDIRTGSGSDWVASLQKNHDCVFSSAWPPTKAVPVVTAPGSETTLTFLLIFLKLRALRQPSVLFHYGKRLTCMR
jgi:hypothetical protein